MQELKRKVSEIINNLNQDWTDAINKGAEDGIDLSSMFGKYSKHMEGIDTAFNNAEIRRTQKKKGFW